MPGNQVPPAARIGRFRPTARAIGSVVFSLLAASINSGCSGKHPTLIPTDGSEHLDATAQARLIEDPDHPLLLRGIDRKPLDSLRIPTAFYDYQYLISPGRHHLWVMSLPETLGGTPIPVGRTRCYILDAEFAAGRIYRVRENDDRALLTPADSDEVLAEGKLVDKFWSGTRSCHWP